MTELPYYERNDDNGRFYAYTYEVTEIKINTEDVTQTVPGQGETSGYTVTWSKDPGTGALVITNTKKPGVDIIVKKVDANKASDDPGRFLEGAKFSLYKVITVGNTTVDELVTDSSLDPAEGSQEITFEIPNPPGQALPSTGGPGTRYFILLGGLLAVFAVLLLRNRRLKPRWKH